MKSSLKFLAAAAAIAGLAGTARAVPTLTITDLIGGGTVTITDNGNAVDGSSNVVGVDADSSAGSVSFLTTLGVWTLKVNTGISDAPSGFLGMDLTANAQSTGAGQLQLTFSDDAFTTPLDGSVAATIGGTMGGGTGSSVTYATYLNGYNTTNLTLPSGGGSNFAFSGSTTGGGATFTNPYTLTQTIVINHATAGRTSFDAAVTVPDSGTTALLIGVGLLGTGLAIRKRRLA